ncbi:MAG: [FeFe] hydrogenase H-cluster radical SAM maturase HydE [Bacteroidota bacterium]|nr:[FeFe] hydrogenase H-cluster radical SAM maturase HydE [Bacteroidota bacterium]
MASNFISSQTMKTFQEILLQTDFSQSDLVTLLLAEGDNRKLLFQRAQAVKLQTVGNKVYFRGLVEFSNICAKDCLYCGIRKSNEKVARYEATDDEILEACRFAWENRFGSVVLQSGEVSSPAFVNRVVLLLRKIKELSNGELGITLSCGEQSIETYRQWRESGAHRYLLRVESSNPDLYRKIHPENNFHSFERRLQALKDLKTAGYQVGTGVMIGFPFQTIEDLANDLLFFKQIDVAMVGMGPYIEHEDTPLYKFRKNIKTKQERFDLALKMVATLRLLMPDINIAAATALQAIDPAGREKALTIGANILMPNLTSVKYRKEYQLYEDKPCLDEDAELCKNCLEARIEISGCEIGYGEWGDSKHFFKPQIAQIITDYINKE